MHFDQISKRRIFESIDKAKTTRKMLKEKYMLLKNRLGRIPTILDFYEYGEVDPQLFVDYAGTYDRFLRMVDSEYQITFSAEEEAVLEFVSSLLINGKRPHELLMLRMLMEGRPVERQGFQEMLLQMDDQFDEADYRSAKGVLSKKFVNTQSEKKKYEMVEFITTDAAKQQQEGRVRAFDFYLQHHQFMRELQNLVEYGLKKYADRYRVHDEDHLVLYEKYSRKDVCRILNWEKDDSSTVYGYRIKYNTCPIFVTYEKKDDISSSTKYEDVFIDQQIFSWMTRNKVSIDSPESQQLIHYRENNLKIFLFVKKHDGEGTDFYYMGRITPVEWREMVIQNDKGQALPIMNFRMKLEHSVRGDIYEYFTR